MNTIKIRDKAFQIADSINELTLGQMQQIMELKNEQEFLTDVESDTSLINILTGISEDELSSIELSSYYELRDHLVKILGEKPNEVYSSDIIIDGKAYRFDTKLDSMHYGMFRDLYKYNKQDFWSNAHIITAILIREVKEDGTLSDYDVDRRNINKEIFKSKLLIRDFNPCSVFFWTFLNELSLLNMQSYLQVMNQK